MPNKPGAGDPVERLRDYLDANKTAQDADFKRRESALLRRYRHFEETRDALNELEGMLTVTIRPFRERSAPLLDCVEVNADTTYLARVLIRIARSWRKFPGAKVLLRNLHPPQGLGHEAAIMVFQEASDCRDLRKVEQMLEDVSDRLAWEKAPNIITETVNPRTVDGMWFYFLTLAARFGESYGDEYWLRAEEVLHVGDSGAWTAEGRIHPGRLHVIVFEKEVAFENDAGEVVLLRMRARGKKGGITRTSFSFLFEVASAIGREGTYSMHGDKAARDRMRSRLKRLNEALEARPKSGF